MGTDLKVGKKCNLGVAFGYVDGDVKPNGLRSADQSGTYMAFYGYNAMDDSREHRVNVGASYTF